MEQTNSDNSTGYQINVMGGTVFVDGSHPHSNHPLNQQQFRNRLDLLLLADVKNEVEGRLSQSLHRKVEALIPLDMEEQPEQVTRPWDAEVKIGNQPRTPLPVGTKIIEVFDQLLAGKLLILGEPGVGKTTLLLELAKELIARAEANVEEPIPVLFNLSAWKDDAQTIADWLVDELRNKRGFSKDIGKGWIENHLLLPLLDGLDELEPKRQELCVETINQFLRGEEKPRHLVVCSRRQEYESYEAKLQLNGAIYLQPLTQIQIHDYLEKFNQIELWQEIENNPNLLELFNKPLFLSIAVLAGQNLTIEQWRQIGSTPERIQYLMDVYIERMLSRKIGEEIYPKNKVPNSQQTKLWLSWLAQQLGRDSQTEFSIEKIQPYWLQNKIQKKNYKITVSLIFVLLFEPIFALSGLLISRPIYGLIAGVGVGLISGILVGNLQTINTIENLSFSWSKFKTNFLRNLITGLILGLIISLTDGWDKGLLFGPILWLIVGITEAFFSLDIEVRTIANQGVRKSAVNACVIGLVGGISAGLIGGAFDGLTRGLIFGLVFGLIFGLISGGITCIQHFSLRLILCQSNLIPWNYRRFLNYATERLLLQRIGGRYRFIHKLLQEHLARVQPDGGSLR